MHILLTNDDGIWAPGIRALAQELEKYYQVTLVAPAEEHSAQSHAITINRSLEVKEIDLSWLKGKAYSVSGTPADSVRVAMDNILEDRPDVVFSGCNLGYNAGMDILYSGTVSAAVEGNMFQVPSVAVSAQWVEGTACFETASQVALEIFRSINDQLLKKDRPLTLNINVPYLTYDQIKGIKVCPVGDVVYDLYEAAKDLYQTEDLEDEGHVLSRKSLILSGRNRKTQRAGTDRALLEEGYATVTPLLYDFNNAHLRQELESWLED
ncbi:MAG: 5'/3'-nucleotidase SurE [Tissierellia bacterium]|nr:5'/3'-nucleotidase SurE [Tissierellia bacterium]